jgi:thioredoxin 1
MQKHIRNKFSLYEISKLTEEEILLFSYFFSNKGRYFTVEKVIKKLRETKVNTKRLRGEKLEAALSAREAEISEGVKAAFPVLEKAGLIQKNTEKGTAEWKMEAYDVQDLPGEQQILIGDKEHTSLTENSQLVLYKGDRVMYMYHALSQQYKDGLRIGEGTVKSYHINEDGFVYVIIEEPIPEGAPEGTKAKTPAKRNTMIELRSMDIPEGAVECVTYKKKAGLKAPELFPMPDISSGSHVLFFTAEWSSKGLHMKQLLESLTEAKELKGKFELTQINTDHQVQSCKEHNIRYAPTLILFKDGKQVTRIDGFPDSENVNKEIYSTLKGVFNPAAKETLTFETEVKEEETSIEK